MALNPTDDYNNRIIEEFQILGITVRNVDAGMIAINRTSCHNAESFKNKDEWEIIDMIPGLIKEFIGTDPNVHVMMAAKTDDDWFVDIYLRS